MVSTPDRRHHLDSTLPLLLFVLFLAAKMIVGPKGDYKENRFDNAGRLLKKKSEKRHLCVFFQYGLGGAVPFYSGEPGAAADEAGSHDRAQCAR